MTDSRAEEDGAGLVGDPLLLIGYGVRDLSLFSGLPSADAILLLLLTLIPRTRREDVALIDEADDDDTSLVVSRNSAVVVDC